MKLITIYSDTNVGNIGPGDRRVFVMDEGTKWVRLFDPHANNVGKVRKFIYNDIYIRDEEINREFFVKRAGEKYGQNANYRKIFTEYATEEEMSVAIMMRQEELLKEILVELKKMNGEEEIITVTSAPKYSMSEISNTKPKGMTFNEKDLTMVPKKRRGRPPGSTNKKTKKGK